MQNQDERTLSIEHTEDGRILKAVELIPRTPEPVTIARRYIAVSKGLQWHPGGGSREGIRRFAKERDEMTQATQAGKAELRPIVTFFDGKIYWLASGFLQLKVGERLMRDPLVWIYPGTAQDAELYALTTGQATRQPETMEV